MRQYKDRTCPGCEKLKSLRSQQLCGECQELFNKAREIIKDYDKEHTYKLYNLNLPTFSFTSIEGYLIFPQIRDPLTDMIRSASKPRALINSAFPDEYVIPKHQYNRVWWANMVFESEFVETVRIVYSLICDSYQEAYDLGLKHGKQLLIGLNQGRVTIEDFEKNKLKRDG